MTTGVYTEDITAASSSNRIEKIFRGSEDLNERLKVFIIS